MNNESIKGQEDEYSSSLEFQNPDLLTYEFYNVFSGIFIWYNFYIDIVIHEKRCFCLIQYDVADNLYNNLLVPNLFSSLATLNITQILWYVYWTLTAYKLIHIEN